MLQIKDETKKKRKAAAAHRGLVTGLFRESDESLVDTLSQPKESLEDYFTKTRFTGFQPDTRTYDQKLAEFDEPFKNLRNEYGHKEYARSKTLDR